MSNTTEPVAILNEYSRTFLTGRPLDVQREDETIEGDTSPIYVSRESCLQDCIEELRHQRNLRHPLEVTFLGELAQDLGGPRREFFENVNREIKESLFTTEDGEILLVRNVEFLSRKVSFYSGLLIGLSVLEGGPCPEYLDEALNNSENSEYWGQFRRGLNRLLSKKPSLKFIFRPSSSKTLTVNKILNIFTCKFSVVGSNMRREEEKTYKKFVKYCREVFAGRRPPISIGSILAFCTGSSAEPLLGFTVKPSLEFVPADQTFASASTCINKLNLPLVGEKEEEAYFSNLDMSFANTFFGLE